MKKLLVLALLFLCTSTSAQDGTLITESGKALEGALQNVLKGTSVYTSYLPSYGLHIAFQTYDDRTPQEIASQAGTLLSGMTATVQGLPEGEWLSVFMIHDGFYNDEDFSLLVRVKPNQPETLEVYINDVKQ